MSDDFLWDRSGEPDPLVEELERKLRPLRYASPPAGVARPRPRRAAFVWIAAAAAGIAIAFTLFPKSGERAPERAPGYEVALLEGEATVGSLALRREEPQRLGEGSVLRCGAGSRARIAIAGLGDADLEGPAEIALERSSAELHRLFLRHGGLRASISPSARPRLFQVGTPAGTAVDLGCIYTMAVRPDGRTELRVQLGRVAFEIGKRSVFVWSGASCVADPARGAGTPVDDAAGESLRSALRAYDGEDDAAARRRHLETALAAARSSDARTLWHLLGATERELREPVYERLAALSPPPARATREACLRGDADALEAWRVDLMGW
ncbi:MAG TPA: hypothetical protein VKE69_06590 [Planctomycetota bacterium]|nr:hypothetical protein [Planctomycetota bacterium]